MIFGGVEYVIITHSWLDFGGDPVYDADPGILTEFLALHERSQR